MAKEKPKSRASRATRTKPRGNTYGKLAAAKVEKAMHEFKRGRLKSGRSNGTVKSREQAIAIGLSQARRKGGKVPSLPTGT
jgi:hypothetical protein